MTVAGRSRGHSIGWLTSLCLHGSLVLGALMATQRMTLAPQPATFTWNVAMIAAPSEPSAAPSETIRSAVSKPSFPTPSTSTLTAQAKHTDSTRTTTVESIVAAEDKPTDERKQTPPIPDSPARMEAATQDQSVDPVTPPTQTVTSQASHQQPEIVSEGSSVTTAFAREQESAPPAEPPSTVLSPVQRPDYTWLSETIMRRMQELKKYPAEARLDHAEGKVVLKAIINSDGAVKAIEVFQSSGHQSLDRAAVDLLNLAAPFRFPRPLEKPQMTVKIPMSYRLEP